ncbi:MAG: hypothetical protein OJF49_002893 [Ktedonobacterales bacterium]|nr:MAG: hypothetical protein OJF49_002893 [Ktedonobacterales bacterium]
MPALPHAPPANPHASRLPHLPRANGKEQQKRFVIPGESVQTRTKLEQQ